ncbi:MAG: glucose-6-phosphate isomerase [Spirochaetaceae bacterium]
MRTLRYTNLTRTAAFAKLRDTSPPPLSEVGPDRIRRYQTAAAEGITYNYAAKRIDDEVLDALVELAGEQQCLEKFQALYNGEVMNTGEGRMVLHHLTRGQLGDAVTKDGADLRQFYLEQQNRVAEFARSVHAGNTTGSTRKPFDTVVQVGIGGSDLGPRAMYLALENYARQAGIGPKLSGHFISNVDPDDAAAVLESVDPETTLFILVSKSGTTQETLTNEAFIVEKLGARGIKGLNPRKHIVAVTSQTSPLAKSSDYLEAFFIDDYIGGRYSSSSAVGGAILSLAFGPEIFAEFLEGAHGADKAAQEGDPLKNAALLDALIGVYERNVMGYPMTAVLPYSQALRRFPAHLQQLDMESNGKSVNRGGEPVDYATGPVVFGEAGTNGQHSFYQLLHQGTDIVPLQFIGFRESQRYEDVVFDGSTSQRKLLANLVAQIVAFAQGKDDRNPNKAFAGNRPSGILYAERLTPRSLGALLAHYENKVMFQGFLWNVNSFDQEGVQLGKVLAKRVLGNEMDPALETYAGLLGINNGGIGTGRNGTGRSGTGRSGTGRNGTGRSGTGRNGTGS